MLYYIIMTQRAAKFRRMQCMNGWLNRMEMKYGRYAIRGITKYFVCATLIGYIFSMFDEVLIERVGFTFTGLFNFNMYLILHGQIWRLVTWIFCSPGSADILGLIFLLCLLSMGNSLENMIGTFRINVYMFGGVLLTLAGGILVYFIGYPWFSSYCSLMGMKGTGLPYISTYYVLLSIFMALALMLPDGQVMLYFIIPIRMKWMLILYFAELGYELFNYYRSGGIVLMAAFGSQIIFALINLGLFYYSGKNHISRMQKNRAKQFYGQYDRRGPQFGPKGGFGPKSGFGRGSDPGANVSRHKCAICGRTEFDDPNLTFRYCSKCAGRYEYCQDHLFTHQHIKFQ